eukprot:TRINITY_DN4004_c0_g1_i1.p1 TRINITY_DN4004_c0_g1~~TRINITY_DN4004_c0_g1_i1.p1  ORF type:complete len:147 (+),score=19.77 TRINITY_DN4004_c0_g1_i1:75-515(+)
MSGAPPDAAAPASLETLSPEELLGMAREQIATGKIEGALDAVVRAIREKCGADRVLTMLAEAKDYANHHRDPGFKSPTEGKTQREILLDAVSGKDSILAEEYDDASEGTPALNPRPKGRRNARSCWTRCRGRIPSWQRSTTTRLRG